MGTLPSQVATNGGGGLYVLCNAALSGAASVTHSPSPPSPSMEDRLLEEQLARLRAPPPPPLSLGRSAGLMSVPARPPAGPPQAGRLPPAAAPGEPPAFTWSACHNLISSDAAGVPVRQPSATARPAVSLQVKLLLPLLYSAERRSWLWHKKWRVPKLHVQVSCEGKPVGRGSWAAARQQGAYGELISDGEPPVYVVVSAGTLRDGSGGVGLYDQGLGGECQRRRALALAPTFTPTL